MEERLEADFLETLVLPRPRQMAALHQNFYAYLGCWRNISIYECDSVSARSEKKGNIRALDWCPGPVVFPLQFYRLTSY